jgi:hypothetical protein
VPTSQPVHKRPEVRQEDGCRCRRQRVSLRPLQQSLRVPLGSMVMIVVTFCEMVGRWIVYVGCRMSSGSTVWQPDKNPRCKNLSIYRPRVSHLQRCLKMRLGLKGVSCSQPQVRLLDPREQSYRLSLLSISTYIDADIESSLECFWKFIMQRRLYCCQILVPEYKGV